MGKIGTVREGLYIFSMVQETHLVGAGYLAQHGIDQQLRE